MELCDICQTNPATIHLTQIENGEVATRHYCEACAEEEGLNFLSMTGSQKPDDDEEINPWEDSDDEDDEFEEEEEGEEGEEGITDLSTIVENSKKESSSERICPKCGITEAEFLKEYEAGCAVCYTTFGDIIDRMVHHYSGPTYYRGKKYHQATSKAFKTELDYLKEELTNAIQQQKFELASVLRDRIRELESKVGK